MYDSSSSPPCEGITNPHQHGLQDMEWLTVLVKIYLAHPRVSGDFGHAAITSYTQPHTVPKSNIRFVDKEDVRCLPGAHWQDKEPYA